MALVEPIKGLGEMEERSRAGHGVLVLVVDPLNGKTPEGLDVTIGLTNKELPTIKASSTSKIDSSVGNSIHKARMTGMPSMCACRNKVYHNGKCW